MRNDRELIELIKSGDFTIVYHDNGCCDIYKGKYDDYDDVPLKAVRTFDCEFDGYLPNEVMFLVQALGGKSMSI